VQAVAMAAPDAGEGTTPAPLAEAHGHDLLNPLVTYLIAAVAVLALLVALLTWRLRRPRHILDLSADDDKAMPHFAVPMMATSAMAEAGTAEDAAVSRLVAELQTFARETTDPALAAQGVVTATFLLSHTGCPPALVAAHARLSAEGKLAVDRLLGTPCPTPYARSAAPTPGPANPLQRLAPTE